MVKFFSIEIRWYAFFIVFAVLFSLVILNYILKNEKELNFEFFLDYIIIALPLAVIGARLYYVIFNLDYYLDNPLKIIAINEGGLAIHGALLMGVAVLFLFSKQKKKNFLKALDYLAPLTAFSQAVGRWGNFINQEAYGQIVSTTYYDFFPEFIKKQMFINGAYREAAFFYESVADFFLFIFLIFHLKFKEKKDGKVFACYLIIYSFFRIVIEERRIDSLMLAEIKIAKLISIIMIAAGLLLFYYIDNYNQES